MITRTSQFILLAIVKKYGPWVYSGISRDTFQYIINMMNVQRITKRNMILVIARIFNPLGLLGPVTLLAKIFIQKLNLDWNAAVSMSIYTS